MRRRRFRGAVLLALSVIAALACFVALLNMGDLGRTPDAAVGRVIPVPSRSGMRYVNATGLAAVLGVLASYLAAQITWTAYFHQSRRERAREKRLLWAAADNLADADHVHGKRFVAWTKFRSRVMRILRGPRAPKGSTTN